MGRPKAGRRKGQFGPSGMSGGSNPYAESPRKTFAEGTRIRVSMRHGYAPFRGDVGVVEKYIPFGKYYVRLERNGRQVVSASDLSVRRGEMSMLGSRRSVPGYDKSVHFRVDCGAPENLEQVRVQGRRAVLYRYGHPVVEFKPTESQLQKIAARRGHIQIIGRQIYQAELMREWAGKR